MAKKVADSVTGADYQRMCDRMIALANRGRKQNELVKSIAKAGNVAPVMDYILRFHKLFAKFNAEGSTREPAANKPPAKRKGGKRGKRNAQPTEEAQG